MDALRASLETGGKGEPASAVKPAKAAKETAKAEAQSWLSVRQYAYLPCIRTRSVKVPHGPEWIP
jgi:hypothetical protein